MAAAFCTFSAKFEPSRKVASEVCPSVLPVENRLDFDGLGQVSELFPLPKLKPQHIGQGSAVSGISKFRIGSAQKESEKPTRAILPTRETDLLCRSVRQSPRDARFLIEQIEDRIHHETAGCRSC
jgi:hypothetical protein